MGYLKKKRVKRALRFYKTLGFRPPYKVLVDGSFLREAVRYSINLKHQLPAFLGDRAFLTTTRCVIGELARNKEENKQLLSILRRYERTPCSHPYTTTSQECLVDTVKAQNFLIGTNQEDLKTKVRQHGKIPILTVFLNSLHMETRTTHSRNVVDAEKSNSQKQLLEQVQPEGEEKVVEVFSNQATSRKRKRHSQPNPLSVKPKKKTHVKKGKQEQRRRQAKTRRAKERRAKKKRKEHAD